MGSPLSGGYNGLVWGNDTAYRLQEMEGIFDLPEIATADLPLSGGGVESGDDIGLGLSVMFTWEIIAADWADLTGVGGKIDTFNTAMSRRPTGPGLPLQYLNNTRYMVARPRRRKYAPIGSKAFKSNTAHVTVEFFVPSGVAIVGVP